MRRRRQKNTLLPKMVVVALLVNAILLPILSQLSVFKNITGRRLDQVRLIRLPPEKKPPQPKRAPPKRRVAKAKPRPVMRPPARAASSRPARPDPNRPRVVASSRGPDAGGAVIDNSGAAPPGRVAASPPPPEAATELTPPPPTSVPPPVAAPAPPPPPVVAPPPPALAPPPPHVPTVVAAEPLSQPRPRVPDDLGFEDIHGDFGALFSIKADGSVTVRMVSSTGNTRLDALALDAARRWTFRAATVDGRPVDSYRRLSIQFYAA